MSKGALQRWEYRDSAVPSPAAAEPLAALPPVEVLPPPPPPPPGLSEHDVANRVAAALAEAEANWAALAEAGEARRRKQVVAALDAFAAERARYFHQAETEVVQLALAVARKILGREARLDPDLLQALVRIALDRMGAGPAVTLRVPPGELARWDASLALKDSRYECTLLPDASLPPGECVVATDLGTASLGIEAQFKQIEEGVLDLLRLRPGVPVQEPTSIAEPERAAA